tara:strand:- start:3385 stop:3900 length:516 start_codon:yes stop_codon:yes gene_type:complete
MERRLTKKITDYNNDVKIKLTEMITTVRQDLNNNDTKDCTIVDDLLRYVNGLKPIEITKEDLMKRKRIKNNVALSDRCCACRANGEQCSRRKKEDSNYCGTHIKGVPHGVVSVDTTEVLKKKEVWGEDIGGIIHYVDSDNNVYKSEDIINNVTNPQVLCKYKTVNGKLIIE